jgi:hypothetical protein
MAGSNEFYDLAAALDDSYNRLSAVQACMPRS